MTVPIYSLNEFTWLPTSKRLVLKQKAAKHERPTEFWVYGKYLHVAFLLRSTCYEVQNSIYDPKGSINLEEREILPSLEHITAVIYWE